MALTDAEKGELVKELGAAVTQSLETRLGPLAEKVESIAANQLAMQEKIEASDKAAEASMRAEVAGVHGEVVANALSGAALADLHSKIGTAAPLATGSVVANSANALTADVANLPKE